MIPSIKLAVFDMAGTTIKDDSNVAKALQQAFFQHGYEKVTIAEANERMGYPKPVAIKEILELHESDPAKVNEEHVSSLHDDFVANMIDHYRSSPDIAPMDDAEDVFKALHDIGIKVGLDTGFSRNITDVILERIGWKESPLVDVTVCSDEVDKGRPYPDMILKMMATLDIGNPNQVIKIGDTEVDINEGLNTGCLFSIGVTTGAYSREELEKHDPSHIVNSLSEILPIVRKHQAETTS